MIFDVMEVVSGNPVRLRPDFVSSAVAGSLFVFSLVPEEPCAIGATVRGSEIEWRAKDDNDLGIPVRLVVAGIHLHFPDWDMPRKTDAERERSWGFWEKEWKP